MTKEENPIFWICNLKVNVCESRWAGFANPALNYGELQIRHSFSKLI